MAHELEYFDQGELAPERAPIRPEAILLFRLPAVDLVAGRALIPVGTRTITVLNNLAAPVYIRFGPTPPAAGDYDWSVPANEISNLPPLGSGASGVGFVSATVDYPGAVPAGDANLFVLVIAQLAPLAPGDSK